MLGVKMSNCKFSPKPPQTARNMELNKKEETQMKSTMSYNEYCVPRELQQQKKREQMQKYNKEHEEQNYYGTSTNCLTHNFNGNETLFDHSTSLAATLTRAVEEIIAQMRNVHSKTHHTRHVKLITDLLTHEGAYGFTPSMLEAGVTEMIAFFVNIAKEEKMSTSTNLSTATIVKCNARESAITELNKGESENDRDSKGICKSVNSERTERENLINAKVQVKSALYDGKNFVEHHTHTPNLRNKPQNSIENDCNIPKSCAIEHFLPPLVEAKYVKETHNTSSKSLLHELSAVPEITIAADEVQGDRTFSTQRQGNTVEWTLSKAEPHKQCHTDSVPEEITNCANYTCATEILLALIEHCTKPLIFLTLHDYQCLPSTLLELYNVLGDILVNLDTSTNMVNETKYETKECVRLQKEKEVKEDYPPREYKELQIQDKQHDIKNNSLYVIRIATLRCLHILLSTYQNVHSSLLVNGERVTLKSMTLNDVNRLCNTLTSKLCSRWNHINKTLELLQRHEIHLQLRNHQTERKESSQMLSREIEKSSRRAHINNSKIVDKRENSSTINLVASKIAEYESKVQSIDNVHNVKDCMLTEIICIARVCMVLIMTCADESKTRVATTSVSRAAEELNEELASTLTQRAKEMFANKLIDEGAVQCAFDSIAYCTQSLVLIPTTFTALDKMCCELSLDLLITMLDILPVKLFQFMISNAFVNNVPANDIADLLLPSESSTSTSTSSLLLLLLPNALVIFINLNRNAPRHLTEIRNDCLLFYCKLLRAVNKYSNELMCNAATDHKSNLHMVNKDRLEEREWKLITDKVVELTNDSITQRQEISENTLMLTKVLLIIAYYCSEQMRQWSWSNKGVISVSEQEEETTVIFPLNSLLQSICASTNKVETLINKKLEEQVTPLHLPAKCVKECDVEYIRLCIQLLTDTCEWTSSLLLYSLNSENVTGIGESYCFLVQELMKILHFTLQTQEASEHSKGNVMSPEARVDVCNDALLSFTKLLNFTDISYRQHNINDTSSKIDAKQSNPASVINCSADKWNNGCHTSENVRRLIAHITSMHQVVLSYVVKSNILEQCYAYAEITANKEENDGSNRLTLQPLHIHATMMIATVCSHVCHLEHNNETAKRFVSENANACANVLIHSLTALILEVQSKDSITENEITLALYCWDALTSLLTLMQQQQQHHQKLLEHEVDAAFCLTREQTVAFTGIADLLANWLNTLHRLITHFLPDVFSTLCLLNKLHELYLTLIRVCQCLVQRSNNVATEIFVKFVENKGVSALLNALSIHITFNTLLCSDGSNSCDYTNNNIDDNDEEGGSNVGKTEDDTHYSALLAHQLMCQSGSYSSHVASTNDALNAEEKVKSRLVATSNNEENTSDKFVSVKCKSCTSVPDRYQKIYNLVKERIKYIISLLLTTLTNTISHSVTSTRLQNDVIAQILHWRDNTNNNNGNENKSIVQILIALWRRLLQEGYLPHEEKEKHTTCESLSVQTNGDNLSETDNRTIENKEFAQECGLRLLGIDVRDCLRAELEQLFTMLRNHHDCESEPEQKEEQVNNIECNEKCNKTTPNMKADALATIQYRVYDVLKEKLHIFFDIYLLLNTIGFEHFYSVNAPVSRQDDNDDNDNINNNKNEHENESNSDACDVFTENECNGHLSVELCANERATLIQVASLSVLCEEELYLAMECGAQRNTHHSEKNNITNADNHEDNRIDTQQLHLEQEKENKVSTHSIAFMRPVSADVNVLHDQLRNIARQRHDINQLYELNQYFDDVQNNSEFEHYLLSRIRQPIAALDGWQTLSLQRSNAENYHNAMGKNSHVETGEVNNCTNVQTSLLPPLMLSESLAARFAYTSKEEEYEEEQCWQGTTSRVNYSTLKHQETHVLTDSWKKCCESTIASTLAATMQRNSCNNQRIPYNTYYSEESERGITEEHATSNGVEHAKVKINVNGSDKMKQFAQTAIVLPATRTDFTCSMQERRHTQDKDAHDETTCRFTKNCWQSPKMFDRTNCCCYCKDSVFNTIVERQPKKTKVNHTQNLPTEVHIKSDASTQRSQMATTKLNLSEQRRKKLAMIARSLKKMPEYDKIKKMNEEKSKTSKASIAEELINNVLQDVQESSM